MLSIEMNRFLQSPYDKAGVLMSLATLTLKAPLGCRLDRLQTLLNRINEVRT